MSQSEFAQNAQAAAKAAVQAARILLNVSEDIPLFGKAAKLINKLIQICDQCKCNKEASRALQVRFCRLAGHLFSGPQGLASIATKRPDNASLAIFCTRMETILEKGLDEIERFTKAGFIMSLLKGSGPQQLFESLDREMTQCLNELSVALHVTALNEQAQIYNVVCDIQAKMDARGGLEGLLADPGQLRSLAQEIGADVGDLKAEVLHVLASLGTQVSVVDENVKEMKAKVDAVHKAVVQMQKTTAAPDMTALQLTSPPAVDRSQVLGEGAFGKVYKGVYIHMDVAVKEVSITAAQDKEFLREVAMHYKVGNLPGVVRLFGANFNTQPRCIVLELAAGTLHDSIHRGKPEIDRALPSKLSLLAQVCTTMAAISDMGILHRDLKSSNVLLFFHNERVYAKISDFGLTKMANESTISSARASPKGTLPYMAPELFRGQYSSASDMYAFAVLLNEVLTEQVPFPGRSYVEIVQSVGTYRHRPDRYKADVTDTLGCELMRCTERCWHQDPALRMSFHELAAELNHLLRKAAEAARVGNQASPLTPPRPPTKEIEDSITQLVDWLSSSCHLAETDAMPLAHTLVTVKHVTSVPILAHIVQRNPDFLSKEVKLSFVHEAKIFTALGISVKSSSASTLKLASLNNAQLCQLFNHCSMQNLDSFATRNNLNGMQLADGIDNAQDLVDLGLDMLTAKALFKRITVWKESGLPEDFCPTPTSSFTSPITSDATTPRSPAVHSLPIAPEALSPDLTSPSAPSLQAKTVSAPAAVEPANSALVPEKVKNEFVASKPTGSTTGEESFNAAEEVRQKRREIAKQARFDVKQFANLRTADDFASGAFFFNKGKTKESFLSFQATVIPKSLTSLGAEDNKLALQCHKDLLGYMGDLSLPFPATLAQDLLQKGLEHKFIRDEIYMQVIKQVTNNPRPESVAKGWQIMCMCVGTFPPSPSFENFLLHYIIEKRDRGRGAVVDYARYCLRTLEAILSSGDGTGLVPSVDEILAYKERPPILATISLVDGNIITENLPITPDLKVAKVLEMCCGWLDLKDSRINTLGMFVYDLGELADTKSDTDTDAKAACADLKRTPRPLRNDEYMGDIIVQKARQRRKFKFVLKRKLFLPKYNYRGEDPFFERMTYLQAEDEAIIQGNLELTSLDEAQQLAAISMAVAFGEEMPGTVEAMVATKVDEFIPPNWRKTKTIEEWAKLVLQLREEFIVADPDDLQERFLKIVQKCPTYGSHWFYVRKIEPTSIQGIPQNILMLPDELLLAFNVDGMHIYTFARKLLLSFPYGDICRWGGSVSQLSLIMNDEQTSKSYELLLSTFQAVDVISIISDYIAAIMAEQK